MSIEMETKKNEEQAIIDHVHDVCDKMMGKFYTYEACVHQILEVHTDGKTVTFVTDLEEIPGFSAEDIKQEVRDAFIPENAKHITAANECEEVCREVTGFLMDTLRRISKGEKLDGKLVDNLNRFGNSIINANRVRTMNADKFSSSRRRAAQ
jgi:hypothetical protein